VLKGEQYDYLNYITPFERMCWTQIFYGDFMHHLTKNVTFYNFYNGSTSSFKIWFTTRGISEFTFSDSTQFFNDSLVNDQSELSKEQSQKLEKSFLDLYHTYYTRAYFYFDEPSWYLLEITSQWLYGYEKYHKERATQYLCWFYFFKLLPSFMNNDIFDKEDGVNNFLGKLIILDVTLSRIDSHSMKNLMDTDAYDFCFNVYRSFWPNPDDPKNEGVLPRWLRQIYRRLNNSYNYPKQIARISDFK